MRKWIDFPIIEGVCSRQAHADFPTQSDGTKTYERELGKEGFFGPCTHMVHKYAPTAWTKWEGPLQPHAYDLTKWTQKNICPFKTDLLFYNHHTQLRWWQVTESMPHLVRNGDGDQLLFIHQGSAELFCDYGHMTIRTGDYVVLPRSTMWRLEVINPLSILMIEATDSSYMLPDKGIVGPHAIFDPAMLDTPKINDQFKAQQNDANHEWQVHIKRLNEISVVTYPFNPLDAMGWHGNLAPVRINVDDIRPLMSHRYHLPPSAHTTFVANRFVVCTFAPRPIESDPGALKVPFYHNNDDYDELIFYHRGQFFSRDNIHPGMVTLHPCGFTHGPHPEAFATATKFARKETDEVAVMVDTRDALEIGPKVNSVECAEYSKSWKAVEKP
ncbi:MAG: homogentisate 1,2-dioxygenase [Proteobacteria bacterium]|nr:homogentisate 1,2-dioxygenase [Pseudomonadota bacterium]